MIGHCVKNPKWKKIFKFGQRLIDADDELIPVSIEKARQSLPDFYYQNGLKKETRLDNTGYLFTEERLRINKIPILIKESPVIRDLNKHHSQPTHYSHLQSKIYKTTYIRFSWNSFYMDEGLHPYDSTYNRWRVLQKRHNLIVNDWKRTGDHILINLQEFKDASLNRLEYNRIKYPEYMIEKIKEIRSVTDRPILIRTHPLNDHAQNYIKKEIPEIKNLYFSKGKPLEEDLKQAHSCVVYNSTSSVESVMYGIPTFTLDPSAVAYEVTRHNLQEIEDNIIEFDRDPWLQKIAFMNWRPEELDDGYLWSLLKDLIK